MKANQDFTRRPAIHWTSIRNRCENMYRDNDDTSGRGFGGTRKAYTKLTYPSKEEFVEWLLAREDYKTLFDAWAEAGFPLFTLTPTIDRWPNPDGGYTFDNMRVVTYHENSRSASLRGLETKRKIKVERGLPALSCV